MIVADTIETWVFDLDNTLYPASSNLFDQVDKNITHFIMQALDLDWDGAYKKQKSFFREFGTTMSGMMAQHGTKPEEYLEFVHNIDLSPLDDAPDLNNVLSELPGRKVIFTNGSRDHANNVTGKLGITHHFDGIFDIIDCNYVPKPDHSVYEKMIATFGINPKTAIMVEDMARNLVPAAALGMTTVWVETDSGWGKDEAAEEHIDHKIDDLSKWLADIVQ